MEGVATRVLIVEDEPNIAEALRFILERAGYEVDLARDGEAALARLAESAPDLLVLDVMLPGRNGFEILKELRADPRHARLPVAVLTAKGQSLDRRTAEEVGANVFLTKPFSNQEVLERLRLLAAP